MRGGATGKVKWSRIMKKDEEHDISMLSVQVRYGLILFAIAW